MKKDTPSASSKKNNKEKGLLLFTIYLKAMALAFTGGMAAIPLLKVQITEKHKLISEDEFLEIIALSNSLPGIIGLNNSIFTGHKIAGAFGALMAGLGVVLPAFISMLFVAVIFQDLPQNQYVLGAIQGIRAISVAVLFSFGLRICIRFRKNWFGLIMILFAATLPLLTGISAFYTILLSGGLGIIFFFILPEKMK